MREGPSAARGWGGAGEEPEGAVEARWRRTNDPGELVSRRRNAAKAGGKRWRGGHETLAAQNRGTKRARTNRPKP
jgi:hypothetical protein